MALKDQNTEILFFPRNRHSVKQITELFNREEFADFSLSVLNSDSPGGHSRGFEARQAALVLYHFSDTSGEAIHTCPAVEGLPLVLLCNHSSEKEARKLLGRSVQDYILLEWLENDAISSQEHLNWLRHILTSAVTRYQHSRLYRDTLPKSGPFQQYCEKVLSARHDVVLVLDKEGIVRYVNPNAENLFNIQPETLLGMVFGIPVNANGNALLDIMGDDRKILGVDMHVVQDSFQGENIFVVHLRDITGARLIQEAIFSEKQRLMSIVHNLGDGLITIDENNCIDLMNNIAERITGWALNDAAGKPVEAVLDIEASLTSGKSDLAAAETGLPQEADRQVITETILKRKDGEERFINVVISPIIVSDNHRQGQAIICRDITRQKKLEDEMLKADKLESIGVLAGGLAHDYNNLLTGILGNVSLAKLFVDSDGKADEFLTRAEKALIRSRQLTSKLLTFSKGGAPVKAVVSLEKLLRESAELVLSGSNVRANFHIDRDLWQAEIDISQINQVIHNLVLNADQAMSAGGSVNIYAQNFMMHSNDEQPLAPGPYIKIMVEDFGEGIDKEDLNKIFDPFFTTKKKGNGLGLAVCYAIIKKHNGYINCFTRDNEGATFVVYIPAIVRHADNTVQGLRQTEKQRLKVLMIDDEQIVIDTASDMLAQLDIANHTVNESQKGIGDFRSAFENGEPFDLVILDLTLPGDLSGDKILLKLREIDPEIKAIVSSGYANNDVLANYQKYGFNAACEKPYSISELERILSDVLPGKAKH